MVGDKSSLTVMAATAAYYALIEYVDVHPWNDIRHGSGQEKVDPAVLAIQGALIAGTARDAGWAKPASVCLYGGWLGLQAASWWVPYFRGASEQMQQRYDRYFSSTVSLLPRLGGREWVPDAAHVVLQTLVAACLVTAARRPSGRRSLAAAVRG